MNRHRSSARVRRWFRRLCAEGKRGALRFTARCARSWRERADVKSCWHIRSRAARAGCGPMPTDGSGRTPRAFSLPALILVMSIRRFNASSTRTSRACRRAIRTADSGRMAAAASTNGSFVSVESANDFVNRTLERNPDQVEAVATGRLAGREAFREDVDAVPYLRDTYGVGVSIVHDPRAARGFSVITAYPRNEPSK